VTEACLEGKEPTSEEIESEVEHEGVPKEEAAVQSVRALKNRHGNRNLAVGCRGQLKKWTQGNGGSRKKLAAACRGMTCCAIPAWHKAQGQDSAARGVPKEQMFGKGHQAKLKGITGIRT
jgi:hypothetical protein